MRELNYCGNATNLFLMSKVQVHSQQHLGDAPLAAGRGLGGLDVFFNVIANQMEQVRNVDAMHRNTVRFPKMLLPDAQFVWNQMEIGFVEHITSGGRIVEGRRGVRLHLVYTKKGPASVKFRYRKQADQTVRCPNYEGTIPQQGANILGVRRGEEEDIGGGPPQRRRLSYEGAAPQRDRGYDVPYKTCRGGRLQRQPPPPIRPG